MSYVCAENRLWRGDSAHYEDRSGNTVMIRNHMRSSGLNSILCLLGIGLLHSPTIVAANEVDGFTEPFQTIEVAAVETGTVKSVEVEEGQRVEKGQVLAQLDDEVHRAALAIAETAMSAHGQLKSAEAEVAMRHQRLGKLETLRVDGHARQEEVERARADLAIAEAHVLTAQEQLAIKRLEHAKVEAQLARRAIRAPRDGVVNRLKKNMGEFVAPNDPYVLEMVCLDPLMATFNIPSHLMSSVDVGETLPVFLEDVGQWVQGEVAVVAPVTDAESSTVRVRVAIGNSESKYRSGERCTLQLPRPSAITQHQEPVNRNRFRTSR